MSTDIQASAVVAYATIYAAKSTKDKHKSIPTQVADCEAMAEREGWTVDGVYSDEGFSAYSGNRGPGLASAREHAARLAADTGRRVVLLAQHSDRFSRGAGDKPGAAEALIEIWHTERRLNVHLRSVQDDFDLRDSASVANMGARNHADSKRKSASVKDGVRRRAERGEWCGSHVADGYMRTADGVVKDPEREYVIDLIYGMAGEGRTAEAIQLALSAEGVRTAPVRGVSRPFTTQRVSQILNNPAYAGIVIYRGEDLPGVQAQWPTYLEPEAWRALQRDRARRAGTTKRSRGRQPTQHLLRGIARCGVCGGPMGTRTEGKQRKDGSRRRIYQCAAAKGHHPESEESCSAPKIDAAVADALMLDGLDGVLSDAMGWREALAAGRRGEREDLERIAAAAADEHARATRLADGAQTGLADAVTDGNAPLVGVYEKIAAKAADRATNAETRMYAAADALRDISSEQERDGSDEMIARLYAAVSGSMAAAEGDAEQLNVVLREWLDAVVLLQDGDEVVCLPHLSGTAAAQLINTPGSERVTVTVDGREVEVEIEAVVGGLEVGDLVAFSVTGTRAELDALAASGDVTVEVRSPAPKGQRPGRGRG